MAFEPAGSSPAVKKNLLLMIVSCFVLMIFSCKKTIQQQQESVVVDAITNGHWYVQQYVETGNDITSYFTGYEFQFYTNGNVDGITIITTKTGTWNADVNNYTITAAFPPSAGDTLARLNYTWKITDSYLDYVEAKTTTATGDNILHLRKK